MRWRDDPFVAPGGLVMWFRGNLSAADPHAESLEKPMIPDDADHEADPAGLPAIVAPEAVASGPPPTTAAAPDDVVAATRRRRRTYIVGASLGLVLAIFVALAFVRVPYYRYSPGNLYPTETLIDVDGAQVYKGDGGQIDFTTVSSKKATVLEALLAHFDPASELVEADKVDGTNAPEQTRAANLVMMGDSKRDAEVVALKKLGYPIDVTGTGAIVQAVGKGMPADNVLNKGDAITSIDGQPVTTKEQAITALSAKKPGDTVTMKVESAPGEPARDASATLTSYCTSLQAADPPKACTDDDKAKPLLGVSLATRDTTFKLPFQLSIDTKDVGGPSAGLALTLGIIDVLTPGSLTGGKHVATTGTIELDGSVGPIGGIQQKTFLAKRSGVELFIVPNDEYEDAKKYAGDDMKVVAVGTLDEALKALADNGGSTDVVQQASAAHGSGTTPN